MELFASSSQDSEAEGQSSLGQSLAGFSAQPHYAQQAWEGPPGQLTGGIVQDSQAEGQLADNQSLQGMALQPTQVEATWAISGRLVSTVLFGSEVTGRLTLPKRFPASVSSQGSQASGLLARSVRLNPATVQAVGGCWASLSSESADTKGWLTVSDIVLHNKLLRKPEIEYLQVSDLYLTPALETESTRLQPPP